MLRHIVLAGLAMTACVTLIPTKTNAATFTVRPTGEIPKKPGESIEFIFELSPAPSTVVKLLIFNVLSDVTELASKPSEDFTLAINTTIDKTTTIATRNFSVLTPVKDGYSDASGLVSYEETNSSGTTTRFNNVLAFGGDVVPVTQPVPEPLTMFGAAAALGYGAILKRKYSKKIES